MKWQSVVKLARKQARRTLQGRYLILELEKTFESSHLAIFAPKASGQLSFMWFGKYMATTFSTNAHGKRQFAQMTAWGEKSRAQERDKCVLTWGHFPQNILSGI
jgi:hypothetical protein